MHLSTSKHDHGTLFRAGTLFQNAQSSFPIVVTNWDRTGDPPPTPKASDPNPRRRAPDPNGVGKELRSDPRGPRGSVCPSFFQALLGLEDRAAYRKETGFFKLPGGWCSSNDFQVCGGQRLLALQGFRMKPQTSYFGGNQSM